MWCTTFRQRHEAKEDHTAPAQPPANDDHTCGLGWGINKSLLKGDILGRNNQHGRLSLRIENLLITMMSSKYGLPKSMYKQIHYSDPWRSKILRPRMIHGQGCHAMPLFILSIQIIHHWAGLTYYMYGYIVCMYLNLTLCSIDKFFWLWISAKTKDKFYTRV